MDKLVSIIIPVYNAQDYIEKCINSILNQTYKKFELLLINDGSNDSSYDICLNYSKKYNFIKLFSQNNSGPSKARNLGLKNSIGEYILFVDSDDYLENNSLELMVRKIENDKSDICICGHYELMGDEKKIIDINNDNGYNFRNLLFDINANIYGYTWGKLVKKACITHFFNEQLSFKEDLVFWYENSIMINKISIINKPLYYYLINNNSISHTNIVDKKAISLLSASNMIIEFNLNDSTKNREIYFFLTSYLRLLANSNLNQKKYIIKNYKDTFEKYYNIYLKSNSQIKLKIKIFIKKNFFALYKLLRKIKYKFLKK